MATAMAFTFAVALLTGVLFGIFPALQTSRPDLHEELKGGAGSSISPSRRRRFTSSALVAGEIALSLMLLVSAGLLLKDFARLRSMDIGVRTEGVWTAAIQLPEADYGTDQQRYQFRAILIRECAADRRRGDRRAERPHAARRRQQLLRQRPGKAVSANERPAGGDSFGISRLLPRHGSASAEGPRIHTADTQAAMATDARMRPIWESGVQPSAEVTNGVVYPTVINEAMARHFWPNENPLGQMFSTSNQNGPWRQVIGVVSDVRQRGITNVPAPEAYDVIKSRSRIYLVLRTSMRPIQPDGCRCAPRYPSWIRPCR